MMIVLNIRPMHKPSFLAPIAFIGIIHKIFSVKDGIWKSHHGQVVHQFSYTINAFWVLTCDIKDTL